MRRRVLHRFRPGLEGDEPLIEIGGRNIQCGDRIQGYYVMYLREPQYNQCVLPVMTYGTESLLLC